MAASNANQKIVREAAFQGGGNAGGGKAWTSLDKGPGHFTRAQEILF